MKKVTVNFFLICLLIIAAEILRRILKQSITEPQNNYAFCIPFVTLLSACIISLRFFVKSKKWMAFFPLLLSLGFSLIFVISFFSKPTSLQGAILCHSPKIVNWYLQNGMDIDKQKCGFDYPLKLVLNQYRYDNSINYGLSINPSHEYRVQIILKMLKLLLDHGADVNLKDGDGIAPLHIAIVTEPDKRVIDLLLAAGANINIRNSKQNTPLHLCASHGMQIDILQMLVEHGSDVNAINAEGSTPLDLAIKRNKPEWIQFLRDHGGKEAKDLNFRQKTDSEIFWHVPDQKY
jgi:hypothetical protein